MSEDKLKDLKSKFSKKENTTSRGNNILKLAIERYVSLGETIQIWKITTYIFILFTLIFMAISTYLYSQKTIYPYIIKVNQATGEVMDTKVLKSEKSNIGENEISYFIKKFINETRTIMLDKKYFDKKLQNINYFMTPESANKLGQILSQEKTNEIFNNKFTRTTEIISVTKLPENNNSYQIRWRERTFNEAGTLIKRRNYISVLKVDFFKPNIKQIEYNPLGIVIKDFNIIQEN